MTRQRRSALLACLMPALLFSLVGCGDSGPADGEKVTWEHVRDNAVTRTNPDTGVEWTIVSIRTDGGDQLRAKQNAEDALSAHPDLIGMVGLWQYNPPAILQAVEARGVADQVKVVGFDEHELTLKAIAEGNCVGTIVQNPYEFGFRSVEYLAATIRSQGEDVPEFNFVPTRKITKDNVVDFQAEVAAILAGQGPTPEYDADKYDTSEKVTMQFVTNLTNPFWDFSDFGCQRAAEKFNAQVEFYQPPNGQISEQKTRVESMIVNEVDGLAISVKEPKGQTSDINEWCKKMKVITVDSDAPDSDRLYYIGTDNIAAGRQAGELLAEAAPEGGKVMIFVGDLTQANANERAQGVINALLGQD
jgi:ribose transport system substrate-binding protein